jgi:ParB-like nuclease domain
MNNQKERNMNAKHAGEGGDMRSDPGAKPELKWLNVEKLYVDSRYQRNTKSEASRKNLRFLAEEFKWSRFGTLIVCFVPAEKKYAVLDGQHRLHAAVALGFTEVPCSIAKDLDFETQAKSFVAINTKRVQLNSLAAFHAAVAAGDKTAAAIKEILDECKIDVPRNPVIGSETGPRQMQSPGSLAKMIGKYSRKHIVWALTIIPEAYGEKKGMMRAMLIKSLTEFAKQTPDVERERMLKVLAALDPLQLERDAQASVTINGGRSFTAMVEALNRLYRNAGRKNAA